MACSSCDEDYDGWYLCVNGEIYGPCEYEDCYGGCEYEGGCYCECHQEPKP